MKNIKAQISIAVVCLILGFFVMLQLKTVETNSMTNYPSQVRSEQLQEMLRLEKDKTEALYKQVMEYKAEISEYQTRVANDDGANEIMKLDLDKAEMMAGMVPLEGPGLSVTLKDGEMANPLNIDENVYIVHDEDILKVVNELKAAGAEAISVNGERIISNSEIKCAGTIVIVNGNRLAPPFVIRGIGDSKSMESAIMMRGSVIENLSNFIKIEIKHETNIQIPAYKGAVEYKYSKKSAKVEKQNN